MEDIFKDVSESEEKTYSKIVSLKENGMGWKKISQELNKPKSTLMGIYNRNHEGVAGGRARGSESVQNEEKEVVESVADQTVIEYIKNNCITKKELEKLKIDIENLVNKRLNYGLKQIKEEIKEQK